MDELQEMKEKAIFAIRHCYSPESGADQILSLKTDTCRLAVVRKEGELPASLTSQIPLWKAILDELGYVQEVTNADKES